MRHDIFSRSREIIDAFGLRLQLRAERHPGAMSVTFARPDLSGRPHLTLDQYGADVLAGFVMSARLAGKGDLPDEHLAGPHGIVLRLVRDPVSAILVEKPSGPALAIPSGLWDRLFAELCIILAHGRSMR